MDNEPTKAKATKWLNMNNRGCNPWMRSNSKSSAPNVAEQKATYMPSYRQNLYHIVFRTKDSGNTLNQPHSKELYAYIHGILKAKKCHLYRINGTENHIHLLCDLNPLLALADFLRDVKVSSSLWLKQNINFPLFYGWAEGYAALTYSFKEKDKIINYIKNQQEHHHKVTFEEEYRKLIEEAGILIDERYFP